MTHSIYNELQLAAKSLFELKALYSELGCSRAVEDKRSKQSWVTAIARFQEEQVAKIVNTQTCAICPKFDAERGYCCLFDMVAKPQWQQTSDCVNNMEETAHVPTKVEIWDQIFLHEEAVEFVTVNDNSEDKAEQIEVVEQHEGLVFTVYNPNNGNRYVVSPAHDDHKQRCECEDVYLRGVKCEHQIAVENWVDKQSLERGWTDVHSTEKNVAVCPDCGGMGCGNCGYRGSRHTDLCQPTSNYRLSLFAHKEGMKSFEAWDGNVYLGLVFQVRNPSQPIENVVDSYYWQVGAETHQHMSLLSCLLFAELGVIGFSKVEELPSEELLDKPFDEITLEEWERLKQYELKFQLVAA